MILPEQLDKESVIQSFSTAILLLFLTSGVYGLIHADDRPLKAKKETAAIKVELVKVEIKEPLPPPPPPEPPPENVDEPPPTPDTVVLPDNAPPPPNLEPPAPARVAAPSPDTAFALPVVGATRVVDDPAKASGSVARGQPRPQVVQAIFGKGKGQFPPPAYPPLAWQQQQQGNVTIDFWTDAEGRVIRTKVVNSTGFPLLDAAALASVKRSTWPGAEFKEVTFDFNLK